MQMATNAVASMPWSYLLLACLPTFLATVVSAAGNATTNATNLLPPILARPLMQLSLHVDDNPTNVPCNQNMPCRLLPLTDEAGLYNHAGPPAPTELNGILSIVQGNETHPTSSPETIIYLSCDSPNAPQQLNVLMDSEAVAITLYSTTSQNCNLDRGNSTYRRIYTMTNSMDAQSVEEYATPLDSSASTAISATIARSSDVFHQGQQQNGTNSQVAMSILYSITGLITLLFLLIIVSGAIRAQRHPERYGPRAGHGGRPRQSRAKGLARALLDTIPIVKFGDQRLDKPDPAQELERNSYERNVSTASPDTDGTQQIEQQSPHPLEVEPADGAAPGVVAQPRVGNEPAVEMTPADGTQVKEDLIVCSICTEEFTVGQDVRVLPCDHKFHPSCIDPWLVNVSGTCPLCRLDLRPPSSGNDAPVISDQYAMNNREAHFLAAQPRVASDPIDGSQRGRRSRFLDWNRLRHATVDERIHALRQYRDSHQATTTPGLEMEPPSTSNENQGQHHASFAERLREKFHIRTRPQPSGETTT